MIGSVKNNFLLNFNIRSLVAHYDELMMFLNELNNLPIFIVLSETFLTNNTKNLYNIPGYKSFHTIRPEGNAGGVSIYILENYNSSKICNLSYANETVEQVAISATINSIKFKVLGVYRKPSNDKNAFTEHLDNLLNEIKNNNIIICGDMNINLFDNSNTTWNYSNAMVSHGLTLCNNKVTRINEENINNSSLIDHIWTNCNLSNLNSYNLENYISDHIPCMLTLEKNLNQSKKTIHYRIINDKNISQLNKKLNEINWNDTLVSDNVNIKFKNFITKLDELYNNVMPIKSKVLQTNKPFCPWVDRELKNMIKHKRNLYYLYKTHSISKEFYKEYEKKVNRAYAKKRSNYFMEKMEVNDIREKWNNLKKLVNYEKSKMSEINNLTFENKIISDKKEICDKLNNYFVSIGTDTAKSIPKLKNTNFRKYLEQPCSQNFKFFKITKLEVINTIKSFKNKSCGVNEIPIKIYKKNIRFY